MAKSEWVIDVSDATFEKEVIERSRSVPVAVDFWAPWCGPCKTLGPLLEAEAEARAGAFVLAKVNVDECPQLAAAFQIQGIPHVMAFKNGTFVTDFQGALPEEQVRVFLDRLVPSETEKQATQAAALESSDPTQAATLYQSALAKDPRNPAVLLGLARLAMARGDEAAVNDFLGRTDFVGDFEPEAEKLRGALELRELARPFGDEASARQKLEANPKKAQLRYELGCVLAAAGRYREALEALLAAGEADPKLAASAVRETMVKIFHIVGVRSELADEFRPQLSRLLY